MFHLINRKKDEGKANKVERLDERYLVLHVATLSMYLHVD